MSQSFARAQVLGNVGGDPVYQVSSNGYAIAKFSIASTSRHKSGPNGTYVDHTSWHNAVVFDKLAELVRERVKKGDRLLIDGRLNVSSWDDKETAKKRFRTDIIVEDISLLSPRTDTSSGGAVAHSAAVPQTSDELGNDSIDDVF